MFGYSFGKETRNKISKKYWFFSLSEWEKHPNMRILRILQHPRQSCSVGDKAFSNRKGSCLREHRDERRDVQKDSNF
jgi:hypothetical protein